MRLLFYNIAGIETVILIRTYGSLGVFITAYFPLITILNFEIVKHYYACIKSKSTKTLQL